MALGDKLIKSITKKAQLDVAREIRDELATKKADEIENVRKPAPKKEGTK